MPPQKSPVVELRLPDFSNVFKREAKPLPMCDSAGLPYTDQAQISLLRGEYEEAAIHGGQEAVEKCFK